jgi:zinc/manganese transport system permease protein
MMATLASQGPAFPSAVWSWNLIADIQNMLGFAFMRNAFTAGTASAIVAGLVGYFVVLRGSSFAAHAISHIGFAGAAGALLLGVNPILGVGVLSLAASAGMGALGKRLRGRDAVIGLIMAASLGLGVLFTTMYQGNAANALAYLFGQIFGISAGAALLTVVTSVVVLLALAAMYRPLLFASLDEEVAQARGVPVGPISVGFLLLMGLAVTEAVQVSGVLLIFALLIAPGAIAERITRRPMSALAVSGSLAVLITWASLTLAYFTPYPVSFYVPALAFVLYLGARLATAGPGLRWPLPGGHGPRRGRREAGAPAQRAATVRM